MAYLTITRGSYKHIFAEGIMKITLVRLPFYTLLANLRPADHLGLGYLSSVLKEKGHDVQLIDGERITFEGLNDHKDFFNGLKARLMPSKYLNLGFSHLSAVMENPQHQVWRTLAKAVVSSNPDLIGMTCYSQNVTAVIYLADILKTHLPDVPIVLGGVHPTANPESTMQYIKGIDYIVVGEGEETIVELCEVISGKKRQLVSKVRGIVYREDGQIKRTNFRPFIPDLDQLPFPDRTFVNKHDYSSKLIFTSRGCPFYCNFCASHVLWTRKVRYRSLSNVLAEIDFLINQHGATRIRIVDDTFTLSKKRLFDFCNLIKEKGLLKKVSFFLGSRVDTLDEAMIEHLAAIGVEGISFGIESGSPRMLEKIGKKINPSQVENIIRLASSHGIRCVCYFMIGHPEETVDDVKQSIKLFERIANRFVEGELNIVSPYPGTQLWALAKDIGWNLPPREFYKLFHQGDFTVNLTAMTDQELKDYYHLFLRLISRHSLISKANALIRLGMTGHIRSILQRVWS